jgi:hypothetical protein
VLHNSHSDKWAREQPASPMYLWAIAGFPGKSEAVPMSRVLRTAQCSVESMVAGSEHQISVPFCSPAGTHLKIPSMGCLAQHWAQGRPTWVSGTLEPAALAQGPGGALKKAQVSELVASPDPQAVPSPEWAGPRLLCIQEDMMQCHIGKRTHGASIHEF